jgi:myo-inositol-1-phosphate synthase
MLEQGRLTFKRISKTESVQSQLDVPLDDDSIHIGPADYVAWQKDNKVCFLRIESRHFGDVPTSLECRLSVEDSPNSAGVVIDALRCVKLALDNKVKGALFAPSSYFMKSPPKQYTDTEAHEMTEKFIRKYGRKERARKPGKKAKAKARAKA